MWILEGSIQFVRCRSPKLNRATWPKPNALDGIVCRFNPFMFKNPEMQAYLMSVIASDPAAETIKESVKNQDKQCFSKYR